MKPCLIQKLINAMMHRSAMALIRAGLKWFVMPAPCSKKSGSRVDCTTHASGIFNTRHVTGSKDRNSGAAVLSRAHIVLTAIQDAGRRCSRPFDTVEVCGSLRQTQAYHNLYFEQLTWRRGPPEHVEIRVRRSFSGTENGSGFLPLCRRDGS
jgi:hypothetical protein